MFRIFAVVSLSLLIVLAGCSSKQQNLITSPEIQSGLSLPIIDTDVNNTNHNLLGMWTAHLNIENFEVSLESTRSSEAHFNVTSIINPVIQINSYDPFTNIIDIDVTITNPYPIDVYDVRLIIYTDAAGHMLTNDDCWTSLYDIPGGLPINPFKAYAKEVQDRKFEGQTQYTENLLIYLPGGNTNVTFAVDASYPSNCEEPFGMGYLTQETLYDEVGSSALIQITVYDHYVINKVNSVELYCPEITGTSLVPFSYSGYDLWSMELVNSTGALGGEYEGFIIATTETSGFLALYDDVKIIVSYSSTGWARTWGGLESDHGRAVTLDGSGNIYVTGAFKDVVDFDPGEGVAECTAIGGTTDAFLSKFDSDANFIWVRTWGGNNPSWSERVAIMNSGDILILGIFQGPVDFDPGPGERIIQASGVDVYINRLDSDGNFISAYSWGGNGDDWGADINVDSEGYVYAAGSFSTNIDLDPGSGEDWHSLIGRDDIFLSKFDMDMNFIWARTWGSTEPDYCSDIAIDSSGNIATTGAFKNTADFDPGLEEDWHNSVGSSDIFLCKLNTDGEFCWACTWGSVQGDGGSGVATNNSGDIFVTGYFKELVDFDPGVDVDERTSNGFSDAFLSKFNRDGDYIWARTWGGLDYETSSGVAVNNSGDIFVTGSFENLVDFDPGPEEDWRTSSGDDDAYLSKFDTDGDYAWVSTWGGKSVAHTEQVVVDNSGNLYIPGYFFVGVDFDPGSLEDWHFSNGSSDAYITKLLPNGYWE